VNGIPLEQVNEAGFLGVMLDRLGTFSQASDRDRTQGKKLNQLKQVLEM